VARNGSFNSGAAGGGGAGSSSRAAVVASLAAASSSRTETMRNAISSARPTLQTVATIAAVRAFRLTTQKRSLHARQR
jgi:hypothetical protein